MNWERDEDQEQEAMEMAERIEASAAQIAEEYNSSVRQPTVGS